MSWVGLVNLVLHWRLFPGVSYTHGPFLLVGWRFGVFFWWHLVWTYTGPALKTKITQEQKTEYNTASIPRVTCRCLDTNRKQEQLSTTQPKMMTKPHAALCATTPCLPAFVRKDITEAYELLETRLTIEFKLA
jgi:hypothetical protein